MTNTAKGEGTEMRWILVRLWDTTQEWGPWLIWPHDERHLIPGPEQAQAVEVQPVSEVE